MSPAVDSVCVSMCVCVFFSLLKEAEDENMQRDIWVKCSVQSDVFQAGVVSDILCYFLIYKNKVEIGGAWGQPVLSTQR